MNEVEEYYLQHFGVKGMKWGVRKKRDPAKAAQKQAAKKAKKADKAMYKEAKGDIKSWGKASRTYNKTLIGAADQNINRKRENKKGYDQAYEKARKSYNRKGRAVQVAALAGMTLSIAMVTNPEAVLKGASVVDSVLGKAASKAGGAASTAGMYAKYAAKASVPVSRTVKNRGYMEAILVNSGNALKVVG